MRKFHLPAPSPFTIYHIRSKFDPMSSSPNAPKSRRTRTTQENEINVALTFVNSPQKSSRQASWELGIPRISLERLTHQLYLKPYRPGPLYGLLEEDADYSSVR
ncbi:hypothetical protein TNCV_209371 [Trichonephila clavipes]|uniref:Uncharacterized protein n=1 Tax=Trichonephila clavipes TaxID=2585209 RepID=A0A8X6SYF6_TRICX|nr:hypothetical protein TNCV_209371 [Trichonephila clavipes]